MPRGYVSSARTASVVLGALLVAGNALVRGGVDLPAVALSAVAAAAFLALAPGRRSRDPIALPALSLGLAGAALFVALQLVPLPPWLARVLSPHTAETLRDALGPLGLYPAWRPLTLDPGTTALELAKAATFAAAAAAGAILAASDRRRDRLLRALALSGVATVALYYVAALVGRSPLLEPRITFVNPNHLAGFLQLAAWPSLGFALRARGPRRAGWLLALTFTASGVFLSLSRAGIAAFFVGVGIFGVLRMRAGVLRVRRQYSEEAPAAAASGNGKNVITGDVDARAVPSRAATRRIRSRTVAILGVAGALAVVSWLALDSILKEMSSVADEGTTAVKLGIWPVALRMIRDFPAAGIGRGAFATVFPSYKWEPLQKTFTHVENEWLQLPLELGVVAGAGVIALFAWAFFSAARRRDLSRPTAGALAGAGALAAHGLFDFSLEVPGVAFPFAIVLGIAARDMPAVRVRTWVVRAGAGALLALAAAGLLVHRAHPLGDDARAVARATSADDAAARARDALRWHPADYVPPAAVGMKLAAQGRCREAAPWLARAMARNPTAPEPHRFMARCFAFAARHALAKREYRLAFSYGDASALAEAHAAYPQPGALLEIAPDTPEGLWAAGVLLRAQPAEAAQAWTRAWNSFRDPRALSQLAAAKLALGENEAALQLARMVQKAAPRDPAGYAVAARALDALSRADEAQAELELGAARLPGVAEVLVPLGLRHLAKQRFSQARATFEAIVATEGPALARKRLLVARALSGQGRLQEALAEAQVARGLLPSDVNVLASFASLAEAVGRFDDAVDALEIAAKQPASKAGAYDERLAKLRAARDEQRIRRGGQGR